MYFVISLFMSFSRYLFVCLVLYVFRCVIVVSFFIMSYCYVFLYL